VKEAARADEEAQATGCAGDGDWEEAGEASGSAAAAARSVAGGGDGWCGEVSGGEVSGGLSGEVR